MRTPRKIKIGCLIFSIEYKDIIKEKDKSCLGLCDTDGNIIILKKHMNKYKKQETLLHECLHAISGVFDLNLNERQINTLGVTIIGLIKDNKLNFLK